MGRPGPAAGFPQLSRSIAVRFPALSPQHRRAVRHLLDHPDDAALLSMRQVAARAGVQPATMLRLARALEFDSYPALRRVFVERLRNRPAGYSEKAHALQRRGEGKSDTVVSETIAAHVKNLQASLDQNDPDRFHACATALQAAHTVYVVGFRSCFPLAFFFHYVYRLFRDEVVLLDARGGTFADDLRGIDKGDALVAISLAPYARETVRAVQFAADRGVTVVAVTDSPVSPLVRRARHTILFATESPSFFHSVTAAMSIIEALLALLVARGGRAAVAAIAQREAHLAEFAAYWRERAAERDGP